LVVSALSACAGGDSSDRGEWRAQFEQEDGLTIVRTIGGSVWNGTGRLVEEASIGSEDGGDAYLLGRVGDITADADRLYVLDKAVPQVRVYDLEGRHLFDVGREGGGPGEYLDPNSVAVSKKDGRIFVRDDRQLRLNVYDHDGNPLETWHYGGAFQSGQQMLLTYDEEIYTPTLVYIPPDWPNTRWKVGLVLCTPSGTGGDTLAPPDYSFEPPKVSAIGEESSSVTAVPFSPDFAWTAAPSGAVISGVATGYRFTIQHRDGQTTVVEKASWRPVPIEAGESRWYKARLTSRLQENLPGWVWNGPALPSSKPAFWRFIADRSHRIWVVRQGPGELLPDGVEDPDDPELYDSRPLWRDTYLVDVFDETGRYMGAVRLPEGLQFNPEPHIEENMLVALVEERDGAIYVKRYRLEVEPE
jgi:hypothetical protein